jgi:hypothetical protein
LTTAQFSPELGGTEYQISGRQISPRLGPTSNISRVIS